MSTRFPGIAALLCGALMMAGCSSEQEESVAGGEQEPAQQPETQAEQESAAPQAQQAASECEPEGELTYICGPQNAEDLLLLGDTGLVLASGMSRGDVTGHLYLIDPQDGSYSELIFGGRYNAELEETVFPNCPGPLNLSDFSIHGLSLNEYDPGHFDLYVTSHGEREAIEIFDLNMTGNEPFLSWRGCVPLPENTFANSVAILDDGGFVTTKMMDPSEGFGPINEGEITGLVYEWHPGEEVMEVPGTELSGANGIALSDDERYMYVSAMGTREIIKFDREADPVTKESVTLDIVPDNVRWTNEGRLITAGGNYVPPEECSGEDCSTGWSVVEVDPETMEATRVGGFGQDVSIQGVSTALLVGDNYWVGTFNGDRVAYFPR